MEANELMFGDWVYSKKYGRNGHVIGITEHYLTVNLKKDHSLISMDEYSEFKPILLTKKIIWLNNMKWIQNNEIAPFWHEGESFYCGCFGGYELEVKYVHEVQNFLRVVGFKKEANEFRIK